MRNVSCSGSQPVLTGMIALHVGRVPVQVRVTVVEPLDLEDRIVPAHHDRVRQRLVVADADDGDLLGMRFGQDGERAARADVPCVRSGDQVLARFEPDQSDVESFLMVPSLLFGVPDEECFVFGKPAGADGDELPECGGSGGCARARRQTADKRQNAEQPGQCALHDAILVREGWREEMRKVD